MVENNIENKEKNESFEEEKRIRTERCMKRIMEILEKENCNFDVQVLLKQGQIIPMINVISK